MRREPGRAFIARWWEIALILGIALALRLANLDHTPHFDELYHILAGRSLIEQGNLCIAQCLRPYARGSLFTLLVAGTFELGDVSVVAARIPSVLAGALWVLVVFLWTRRFAGRGAAWFAGLLFAFAPGGIYLSQISRFYALHGLLFWLGISGFFLLFHEKLSLRNALLVGAGAALFFFGAYELQITTLVGLAGVGLWVIILLLPRLLRRLSDRPWFRWAVAGGIALAVAAVAVAWGSGLIEQLWTRYRWSSFHAAGGRDDVLFYHRWFMSEYPGLYTFFPLAAIVALARVPRPGFFSAVVFLSVLVLHSFAGFKGFRLIYYAMPFFFILWGVAASAAFDALRTYAATIADRLLGGKATSPIVALTATAGLGIAFLFALGTTTAYNTTYYLLTANDAEWPASKPHYRGQSDWEAVDPVLQPIADTVEVVLTSAPPKAIYYLDRVDGAINRNQLYLGGSGTPSSEFSRAPQTGHPVISEPGSVRRVLECYRSGLIVSEDGHWARPAFVPPATAAFVEARTARIPLPEGTGMVAFRWRREGEAGDAECSPLPFAIPEQVPRD